MKSNFCKWLGTLSDDQYNYPSFREILENPPCRLSNIKKDIFNETFYVFVDILDMLICDSKIYILFNSKGVCREVCRIYLSDIEYNNPILNEKEKIEILDKYFVFIVYSALIRRDLNLNVPEIINTIITMNLFNIKKRKIVKDDEDIENIDDLEDEENEDFE